MDTAKKLPSLFPQRWGSASCLAIISCICAVFFRYCIPVNARSYYSIGLLPVLFAVVCYFLLKHALRATFDFSRLAIVVNVTLALLFSACFVVGAYNIVDMGFPFRNVFAYVAILINGIPFYCMVALLWNKIDALPQASPENKIPLSRKMLVVIYFGMLACWLPILLASWPGFFTYDVGSLYLGEWSQYDSGELNNHHSVLHTLLLGSVISFVKDVISFNAGVALFNVLQAMFIAGVFTYVLAWLKHKGTSRVFLIVAFVYFAVNPIVSMFVLCSNSDTLFSAITILLCVALYDCFSQESAITWRRGACIAILAFLFCALRPNAPYALAISFPFLFFLSPKHSRFRILVSFAIAGCCFLVWSGPICAALDVEDSELQKVNAFTIPSQQMAYVYWNGQMSTEEQETLMGMGYILPTSYQDDIGDYARDSISSMSKADVLKAWAYIGIRHPGSYVNAFLLHTQDAWNPYSYVNARVVDGSDTTSFFGCNAEEPAIMHSKIPALYDVLKSISTEQAFQRIPFLALLVYLPGFIALLLLAFARSLIRQNRAGLATCLPLLLLVCSALLGPGVIVRYYLYLLFAAPIIVFVLIETPPVNASLAPP